jgi:hypothetical protein
MRHLGSLLALALLGLSASLCADETRTGASRGQSTHDRFGANADGKVTAGDRPTASRLGIGFLWTRRSQRVAGKLTSERDFVDLILGPGKLDVFETVKPPVRVACIARSLERNDARPFPGVRETIEILRRARIAPERVIISYNPERQPGTPTQEMDELVASARRARQMARAYGAPLLVAPGLRDMQRREHLYPELARHCDIWMIQSQRLQLDPVTRKPASPVEYRQSVKRIVHRLREGNPDIRVFVQVVTTAERGKSAMTAEQITAYARAVEDLADAVRIYGGSEELLSQIIERLGAPVPEGSQPNEPCSHASEGPTTESR